MRSKDTCFPERQEEGKSQNKGTSVTEQEGLASSRGLQDKNMCDAGCIDGSGVETLKGDGLSRIPG